MRIFVQTPKLGQPERYRGLVVSLSLQCSWAEALEARAMPCIARATTRSPHLTVT